MVHAARLCWWAQQGSNLWLLACKAEYGTDYAQLCALIHALELRKPCREMSQGAWGSLHGGSRKWFPEQSADPSHKERVGVGLSCLPDIHNQELVTGRMSDCYHRCYHRCQEVVAVAALNIRNLNETVKRRLQVRAARHGRSMEAEVRAILEEAVREPADSAGLFTALLDRFGALGGVDLDLPGRDEPARAADFSA
jgi:antitoxin FitA